MTGFTLNGRSEFKRHSLYVLLKAMLQVAAKRAVRRPTVLGWKWNLEVWLIFWREQMKYAFSLPDMQRAREYIDSLVFDSPSSIDVEIRPNEVGQPRGQWFIPRNARTDCTMLYFHGGGYAFYAKSHQALIAAVADATCVRTFALDYRLTPEHSYPAQLEDAVAAYQWLLNEDIRPSQIVIAGDSAGGHLVLSALIAFRESGLPQPAVALGLCPWTDIGNRGKSLFVNDQYDWVQGSMALKFGEWLKGNTGLSDTELSPISDKLSGLAPIYLQAGEKEILYDMICDFATTAREQGAELTLDTWKNMPHDFQGFGNYLEESREALKRIGSVVKHSLRSMPSHEN